MIPIALDPQFARIAVAGNGALALRRLRALRAAGATEALLFSDSPIPELLAEAGLYRLPEMPNDADLGHLHALWIVDVAQDVAEDIAARARALRVLVNVEDQPSLCDFHSVAEVRRGDLLLTISTGGSAPGLAGSIRRNLEYCFTPDWADRVHEIATLRAGWRAEGLGMAEAAKRIDTLVAERCWLSCRKPE
ncbi:MAG: siroheme synthase [Acidocella sp. 20-57-95]|nr:MAG: siroheme synthase [Acidocella sp. 20-57-95]OYV61866.1 MAG: siroheme synthase [Acidocella sp. 21-58-7]HQT63612.1 NAD(P)-dependent oxidoreductase [Acidocella sp.]HQU04194.1 NAD(P)-dependent oxidoreductase [Acidocella sp.]